MKRGCGCFYIGNEEHKGSEKSRGSVNETNGEKVCATFV